MVEASKQIFYNVREALLNEILIYIIEADYGS